MTIKVNFDGFYKSFKPTNNSFVKYLIDNEFICLNNLEPDLTIYGEDFNKFKKIKKRKILLKVENIPFNDWKFKYVRWCYIQK